MEWYRLCTAYEHRLPSQVVVVTVGFCGFDGVLQSHQLTSVHGARSRHTTSRQRVGVCVAHVPVCHGGQCTHANTNHHTAPHHSSPLLAIPCPSPNADATGDTVSCDWPVGWLFRFSNTDPSASTSHFTDTCSRPAVCYTTPPDTTVARTTAQDSTAQHKPPPPT